MFCLVHVAQAERNRFIGFPPPAVYLHRFFRKTPVSRRFKLEKGEPPLCSEKTEPLRVAGTEAAETAPPPLSDVRLSGPTATELLEVGIAVIRLSAERRVGGDTFSDAFSETRIEGER